MKSEKRSRRGSRRTTWDYPRKRDRGDLTRSYQRPKILATGLQFHRWRWRSCSVWFTGSSCLSAVRAHKRADARVPPPPVTAALFIGGELRAAAQPVLLLLSKGCMSVNLTRDQLSISQYKSHLIKRDDTSFKSIMSKFWRKNKEFICM